MNIYIGQLMNQIAIHETIKSFGLDLRKFVGWSSDGCSTMLGKNGGVAKKLLQSSPSLVRFHCPAHRLELAIQDIAKNVCPILLEADLRMNTFL
jgi:hypothetical protein